MSGHRPEIARAIRFIGENLERPLTVAEVARAAHLSEYHLHRVFHAEVGESVGRFVTRRRLEIAALRLAYEPERPITDVALSSGYSSPSNFSKAFSGFFGCSPTRVREPAPGLPPSVGKLTALHGKDFRPEDLYALPPESGMEERQILARQWEQRVRYETVAERPVACLAAPGGYDVEAIERTWTTLIQRAEQLGLVAGPVDAWGVAYDSPQLTAPEQCRYHACIPCPAGTKLPAPLFAGAMPAGRYAIFRYQGAASGVADAYREIYSCWFRDSSLSPEDYAPFDHYVADFPRDGQIELEMWLRVRARG